jgi:prepilin-type N-terminal cleavage/methylation domain-containing protein
MRNKYQPRRLARGGYTLIEVLATLSILLLIAITAVSMLNTVTALGLSGKQNAQQRVDVGRLAARFRADIYRSDDINLDNENHTIDLSTAGGLVRYRCQFNPTAVTRERVEPTGGKSFERFPLTTRCEPTFSTAGNLVVLRLTPADARIPWVIEATRR